MESRSSVHRGRRLQRLVVRDVNLKYHDLASVLIYHVWLGHDINMESTFEPLTVEEREPFFHASCACSNVHGPRQSELGLKIHGGYPATRQWKNQSTRLRHRPNPSYVHHLSSDTHDDDDVKGQQVILPIQLAVPPVPTHGVAHGSEGVARGRRG